MVWGAPQSLFERTDRADAEASALSEMLLGVSRFATIAAQQLTERRSLDYAHFVRYAQDDKPRSLRARSAISTFV
jgi:hypothetical protein